MWCNSFWILMKMLHAWFLVICGALDRPFKAPCSGPGWCEWALNVWRWISSLFTICCALQPFIPTLWLCVSLWLWNYGRPPIWSLWIVQQNPFWPTPAPVTVPDNSWSLVPLPFTTHSLWWWFSRLQTHHRLCERQGTPCDILFFCFSGQYTSGLNLCARAVFLGTQHVLFSCVWTAGKASLTQAFLVNAVFSLWIA